MLDDSEEWSHYALNVPFYTHFTSPIRRYADVVVHRLLAECLGEECGCGNCGVCVLSTCPLCVEIGPKCSYTRESIDEIAQNCNKRKMAAKIADVSAWDIASLSLTVQLLLCLHQTASRELFFAFFVKVSGWF